MIFTDVIYGLRVDSRLAEHFVEQIAAVYAEVREVLDERQRRLMLGATARRIGRGGVKQVAAAVVSRVRILGTGVCWP
jgi:hypothetical protein